MQDSEIQKPKTRTVFVKCIVVDSDGTPVNQHGEPTSRPWYSWEKRRRPIEWINKHPDLWMETKGPAGYVRKGKSKR